MQGLEINCINCTKKKPKFGKLFIKHSPTLGRGYLAVRKISIGEWVQPDLFFLSLSFYRNARHRRRSRPLDMLRTRVLWGTKSFWKKVIYVDKLLRSGSRVQNASQHQQGPVHTNPFSNENGAGLFRFQKDFRPHLSLSYRFRPSTLQRRIRFENAFIPSVRIRIPICRPAKLARNW